MIVYGSLFWEPFVISVHILFKKDRWLLSVVYKSRLLYSTHQALAKKSILCYNLINVAVCKQIFVIVLIIFHGHR